MADGIIGPDRYVRLVLRVIRGHIAVVVFVYDRAILLFVRRYFPIIFIYSDLGAGAGSQLFTFGFRLARGFFGLCVSGLVSRSLFSLALVVAWLGLAGVLDFLSLRVLCSGLLN